MIPTWKKVKLEDIATVERGKFSARPRNDPKYYGGDIPFLQTGDVATSSGVITTFSQTLNENGLQVSKLFPAGTLLITIAANIGDVAEVAFDFACPDSLVAVRPHKGISKNWLKYFLQTKKVFFESQATQNAQANINLQTIKPLKVSLPSDREQQGIASIIFTWDTAIEKTERLIAAKGKCLNWFRQYILTRKIRLPGSYQDWKEARLGNVLTEHKEFSTGKEEVCSVSVHKGLINQVEHLGRVFAAHDTSKYKLTKPGDIVYTKSPTGDFPLGIIKQNKLDRDVIVSPLYGVFSPITVDLGVILDCYFESPVYTVNYLKPIIQKGAKNTINITNDTFLSNSLLLPIDSEEQKKIATIINTIKKEIDLHKKQLAALQKQKRGLMQKLLTGQWRVKVSEEVP